MDIYIIHEFYNVKFIYLKNTLSHKILKLIYFSSMRLGFLPLVHGRQVSGSAMASRWRELLSEGVRGQLPDDRL